MSDDDFMAMLVRKARDLDGFIGSTWVIAAQAKLDTSVARKRMIALEKIGKVRRIEKWSGPNSIAWALA